MLSATPRSELVNACQILFSSEGNKCSVEFIQALEPDILKKIYRKRALETHPDRCKSSGQDKDKSGEEFRKVQSAYETLKPVATGVTLINPEKPRSNKKAPDSFYKGPLPVHKLLFGQFMYYSGIITWDTLMQAIVWQRRNKSLYGQIALQWKLLSPNEVFLILQNKKQDEKFGEYAKKYGYLTIFQHLAIIGKQKTQATLFGDYFIQKRLLSKRQIDTIAQKTINHNRRLRNHL